MTQPKLLVACLTLAALLTAVQSGEAAQRGGPRKVHEPPPPVDTVIPADIDVRVDLPAHTPMSTREMPPARNLTPVAYTVVVREDSGTADEKVVKELIKIMDETKSPQTLLATTLALMPMGKKAQSAVPAIIRNAERLKVLGALKDMNAAKSENATVILMAVMAIQMDMQFTKDMVGFPFGLERSPVGGYAMPPSATTPTYGYPPCGPAGCPIIPSPASPILPPAPTLQSTPSATPRALNVPALPSTYALPFDFGFRPQVGW
jgi:hypothetical protein